MEIKDRVGRSLENELRLIGGIQDLGFVMDHKSEYPENGERGWTRYDFDIKLENNGDPDLQGKLVLRTHPILGVNVSITSRLPYGENRFSTQKPVSERRALIHIEDYIESIN